MKEKLLLAFFAMLLFMKSEWILEDAEDGKVEGWRYERDGLIENLYDDILNSQVIVFKGDVNDEFAFDNFAPIFAKSISWSMFYERDFRFIVKVKTDNIAHSPLYIEYLFDALQPSFKIIDGKRYLYIGIGKLAKYKEWVEVERNLERDIQKVFDDTILSIDGIYIYGSGRIDNLVLKDYLEVFPSKSRFFEIPKIDVLKPALFETFIEPVFGTSVTRITNRKNESANSHPYPKSGSAWNCDSSVIKMQYRLYDAKTFKELTLTANLNQDEAYRIIGSPLNGSGDIRWSKSKRDVLYVLDSKKRFKKVILNFDKNDTATQVLVDMSQLGFTNISIGNSEGNLDYEDKYVVFSAKKDGDSIVYAILFDLSKNEIVWIKELKRGRWRDDWSEPDVFDWISVDPSAKYILVNAEHKIWLYNLNLEDEIQLSDYGEHGDIGVDLNGDSIYVQFIYGGVAIRAYNLRTLKSFDLLDSNYGGGHISCRNYKRRGWCYVSTSQEGFREVFAINLNSKSILNTQRFVKTRASDGNARYAQVNVNPDGTRVIFQSDWGDYGDVLDTYQAVME